MEIVVDNQVKETTHRRPHLEGDGQKACDSCVSISPGQKTGQTHSDDDRWLNG